MKQKDYMTLGIIIFIATIFSVILSGKTFSSTKNHDLKAPEVQEISSQFPDIKNDPAYNTVFNNNALNPTQLIQIGTNQNPATFNSSE